MVGQKGKRKQNKIENKFNEQCKVPMIVNQPKRNLAWEVNTPPFKN